MMLLFSGGNESHIPSLEFQSTADPGASGSIQAGPATRQSPTQDLHGGLTPALVPQHFHLCLICVGIYFALLILHLHLVIVDEVSLDLMSVCGDVHSNSWLALAHHDAMCSPQGCSTMLFKY